MDELFKAMQMFKQGVQDLQFSRSLNTANDMVRQIKASEMNEQQKYNALNELGQQFARSSMGLGRSASEVELAMKSFAPPVMTPEQRFDLEAQHNNVPGMQDAAKDIETKAKAKASPQIIRYQGLADNKADKAEEAGREKFINDLNRFVLKADENFAARGNAAQLKSAANTAIEGMTMLDGGKITNKDLIEASKALDRSITRAAPTVSGTEKLQFETAKQDIAQSLEYITGNPQELAMPEAVDYYRRSLNRIKDVTGELLNQGFVDSFSVYGVGLRKKNPALYDELAPEIINRKTGRSYSIDPSTGRFTKGVTSQPAGVSQEEKVAVISPTGQPGMIPKSKLQTALKRGFKVQ
jgi:hypothetical protein